jgi:hypothetical protein
LKVADDLLNMLDGAGDGGGAGRRRRLALDPLSLYSVTDGRGTFRAFAAGWFFREGFNRFSHPFGRLGRGLDFIHVNRRLFLACGNCGDGRRLAA